MINIKDLKELEDGSKVVFIGEVTDAYLGIAKNEKKTKFLRLKISDETSEIETLLFNNDIEYNKTLNNNKGYEKNNIVLVKGTKKNEKTVFANLVAIQDHKIYMKLSELKS